MKSAAVGGFRLYFPSNDPRRCLSWRYGVGCQGYELKGCLCTGFSSSKVYWVRGLALSCQALLLCSERWIGMLHGRQNLELCKPQSSSVNQCSTFKYSATLLCDTYCSGDLYWEIHAKACLELISLVVGWLDPICHRRCQNTLAEFVFASWVVSKARIIALLTFLGLILHVGLLVVRK